MRLRSLNLVSLLVILASAIAFAGVPGLRENLGAAFKPSEYGVITSPDLPRNEQEALVAEASWGHSPESESIAYDQARRLAPRSPAPHLIFARINAEQVLLNRSEEDALWPDAPENQKVHPMPISGEDRLRIANAQAALGRAARLDPGNAAIDFVQAYLAIAQHQDALAAKHFDAMLTKRSWTFYERDVTVSAYELVRRTRSAREAALATASVSLHQWAWLREFARVLEGMALNAEARGDQEQAILLRESGMHAGRLMMEHGYTLIEAMTGSAVWEVCAADALTPTEKREIEKQATLAAPTEGGQRDARTASIRRAQFARFASYLRRHGRADLATEVTAHARRRADWHRHLRAATAPDFALFDRYYLVSEVLSRMLRAVAPLVGLIAAVGFATLLLRLARRPVRSIAWPRVGWLLVYAVSLGTAFAFGVVTQMNLQDREWSRPEWEHDFCIIALPVVCALTLAVVLLRRRRHLESRQVGPVRSYVGTLLAVLLPFAALLCPLCLGLAVSTAFYGGRWASVERAIVYQGEVGYYHLTVD